jgi:hypothetical protein
MTGRSQRLRCAPAGCRLVSALALLVVQASATLYAVSHGASNDLLLYDHVSGSVSQSPVGLEDFPSNTMGQTAYDPVARTYYTIDADDVLRGFDLRHGKPVLSETHKLKHRLTSLEFNTGSLSYDHDGTPPSPGYSVQRPPCSLAALNCIF